MLSTPTSHFDMALSVISRIVTIPRFDKPFVWMKQARVSSVVVKDSVYVIDRDSVYSRLDAIRMQFFCSKTH